MALNILLCKFMDAFIQTDTNIADLMRVASIIENVKIAKTITHVCREIDHHNNVSDTSSPVAAVLLFVTSSVLLFPMFPLLKTCSS